MLWPKINSYKEFDNEKKFLRLENSPPPHNFSNGQSLRNRKVKIKAIQKSSKYINTSKGDSARPPIQVFSAPDSAKL